MSTTYRRFATIWRILCGLQAGLVLTQAVLAGHMLSGNGSMFTAHEAVGTSLITWVGLGQIVAAVLLWRPGRGPAWPIPTAIVLFGLIILQLGWGFDGRVALHVPVGVTLLGAQLVLLAAVRSERPRADAPAPAATTAAHEDRP